MLTDFQKRKFTRMFNALDVDGDKGINHKDVELLVKRHAADAAGRASPEQIERLGAAYDAWYSGIIAMADQDQDGNVTLDEFLAFSEALATNPVMFEEIIGTVTQMTLVIMDHDGDGKNDTEDYVRFCRVLGIDEPGAAARWAAMSSHRGGLMGVDDMKVVLSEFFRGTDPKAPATNFLGTP